MLRSLEIVWPSQGVAEDEAFEDQPPLTTSYAKNVRLADKVTGRDRGSDRAGYSRWTGEALPAKAAELVAVGYRQQTVDYSIEKTRNFIQEGASHDFQAGPPGSLYWTFTGATQGADVEVGGFPTGVGKSIADADGGTFGFVRRDFPFTLIGSGDFCISAYARRDDASFPSNMAGLRLAFGATEKIAELDLNTGLLALSGGGTGGGGVVSLGGGAYRFWVWINYASGIPLTAQLFPDREFGASTNATLFDAVKLEKGQEPTAWNGADGIGTLWQRDNPDGTDCRWLDVDERGNIFALYGTAALRKLSADGAPIWSHQFPTKGDVGVVAIDEIGRVFAGVSGRPVAIPTTFDTPFLEGDVEEARLWCYAQDFRKEAEGEDTEVLVEQWSIGLSDGLRGFVTQIKVDRDKLYTVQNDPREGKAWLVVYEGLSGVRPIVALEQRRPYPCWALDASEDGRIATGSGSNVRRGQNPLSAFTTDDLVGWTPLDLDEEVVAGQPKFQIWSWFKFDDLNADIETDQGNDPEDGASVVQWRDRSGKGRNLSAASLTAAPKLRLKGLAGRPCLVFDGLNSLLQTLTSASIEKAFFDNQRGVIPNYRDSVSTQDSGACTFMILFRPEKKIAGTVADQQVVFDAPASYTAGVDRTALVVNREANDTAVAAGATSAEEVSLFARMQDASLEPGQGTASGAQMCSYQSKFATLTANKLSALLVSVNLNNGVNFSGFGGASFHVWATPIDRATQEAGQFGTGIQYLGGSPDGGWATLSKLSGEVYEIICLDRRHGAVSPVLEAPTADMPLWPTDLVGDKVGSVYIQDEGTGGTPAASSGSLTFTGGGGGSGAAGTWASADGKLTTVTLTNTGQGYTTRPNVSATGFNGGGSLEAGMFKSPAFTPAWVPSVFQKLRGYLAWKFGCAHLLRRSTSAQTITRENSSGTEGSYTWLYDDLLVHARETTTVTGAGPDAGGPPTSERTRKMNRFTHKGEVLVLCDASGKHLDVLSEPYSGFGYGVKFSADGKFLFTVGSSSARNWLGTAVAPQAALARKIAISETGEMNPLGVGGWLLNTTALHNERAPVGIALDANDNLYLPANAPAGGANLFGFRVLRGTSGATIHEFTFAPQTDGQATYCIATPVKIEKGRRVPFCPDYGTDLLTPNPAIMNEVAERLVVAGANTTYAGAELDDSLPMLEGKAPGAIRAYRLVKATPNGKAGRLRAVGAVSAGGVYMLEEGLPPTLVADGLFEEQSPGYVQGISAFDKAYFTNGASYVVWDPFKGTAETWKAKRGTIPPRCSGIEFWRGRIVLFGDQEFPGAAYMARLGEPDDFDFGAPTRVQTRAVSLGATLIGAIPDRMTGFIPYDNDNAIILADGSLWRLSGDPGDPQGGARLDRISAVVGGAFGRAWCIDPWGRIWFVGRRGGLWLMAGLGAMPERVSIGRIERRLEAVNQSTHYFRLAYHYDQSGIAVAVMPFGDAGAVTEHFFVELVDDRTAAFWPDELAALEKQMTSLLIVDGDAPDDRRLLIGCQDGFVRFMDLQADDDDGTPVEAFCRMGPFHLGERGREIGTVRLHAVFAHDQDGVAWSLYASSNPDLPGPPKVSGTFPPGRTSAVAARALGSYVWVELAQSAPGQSFALEHLRLEYRIAGRQRERV